MNNSALLCLLAGGCFLFVFACSTSRGSTSREVKKETSDKRKSPTILVAKEGNFYLNLRQNNSFDYFGLDSATKKAGLYAGSYELKGDSLLLAFYNNFKPADLTNLGFVDRAKNEVILLAKDTTHNRRMEIIKGGK
jgi:hypothetical protein